jgi:hypothetical protein
MDHREQALFEAFAVPSKRQRDVELLTTNKGRDKIRVGLDHFNDLDPRFCTLVAPSEQNPDGILRILKGLGAPPLCYVMSSGRELDGREMDLAEALTLVIGRGFGTFVSCVPGKLAYFEGETQKLRYICRRNRSSD